MWRRRPRQKLVRDGPLAAIRRPPPTRRYPCALLFWFLGAGGYYFYVRFSQIHTSYAAVILAIELLGISSFLPYAILITRGIYPTGSPGLPAVSRRRAWGGGLRGRRDDQAQRRQ